MIPASVLTRDQKKQTEYRPISGYGTNGRIRVNLQYDDSCRNGHNSFAITAEVITRESLRQKDIAAGGCLHEDIAAVFPEYQKYIKWHLMSSSEPMYYVANTIYWIEEGNFNNARSSAVWPEATDEDLRLEGIKDRLNNRLESLLNEFKTAMEELGFVY